jgi:hypothetical protein
MPIVGTNACLSSGSRSSMRFLTICETGSRSSTRRHS